MTELIGFTFVLLIAYQIKHFLADYPLQIPYMLKKFSPSWDFVMPLFTHAAVHGLFTLVIVLIVNPKLWFLALVDMGIHFAMDRIKAGPKFLGRFKALSAKEFKQIIANMEDPNLSDEDKREDLKRVRGNTYFWWSLGLDQMVHHLTHYLIIYILVLDKFLKTALSQGFGF